MAEREGPKTSQPNHGEVPPHYLAVLPVITSAAFIQDKEGRYLGCNKAFELFLSLPKDAIIGKSVGDIYPATLADRCRAEDREVLGRGEPCRFPLSFKGMDGRPVDGEITKIPLQNCRGEVVGILGVFSDVSQSKLFKEALVRYELLLRHSADFIWIIDPQTGRIVEVNEAACAAYGYTRKEFQNLSIHDLQVDDRQNIDRQLAEARQKGVLIETIHRRKDGTTFPVQVNSTGASVGGREVLVSIVRDMTEVVRTREALAKKNEYLAMLHQTALALINRLDVDELFEQITARAATLAGSDNAFIFVLDDDGRAFTIKAGTGICASYLGEKFPTGVGVSARVLAAGEAVLINNYKEWTQRPADARLGPVEAIIAVPLLADGKVVGLIGVIATDPQTKFSEDHLAHVKDFANLASLALANARLYAAAQAEIGERRRAEEALRQAEAMTRSFMDSGRFGMTTISSDMRILVANKYLRDRYPHVDYASSPLCYQTYYRPDAQAPCPFCPVTETFKDGQVHEAIYSPLTPEGVRKIRLLASPIKDDKGNTVAAVELTEDITARVRAEEEIRKLSQAVDQSPSLVIITDTDGCITYVNAKFTEMTGYTLHEIGGMTPRVLKSGLQDGAYYRKLWETVKVGREWKGEICNRKKNGELFWVLSSISPVRNLEGKVAYYLAIQQDVTEQKNFEATLQRQNLEIQRTLTKLQQTQTQLVQQEKMAGIGQLAAGVAHEINNPLGFVLSNFETLRKYMGRLAEMINAYRQLHRLAKQETSAGLKAVGEELDELEKKNKLDYIMGDLEPIFAETGEGINRVENIIKALRLFSRVDQQDSFEEYDLNASLKTTLIVARNEVKYIAEVEEDLGDIPTIKAMGGKINQVLLNIVLNAAQAIKTWHSGSGGLIKIRSYADSENVYCAIADNGPGIPDEVRPNIFNPFFTTKPVGEGIGLGLSISYEIIVSKHHGDILVDSKPGLGATFTIKLPIKQPQAGE